MRNVFLKFILFSLPLWVGYIPRTERPATLVFPQSRTVKVRTAATTVTAEYDTAHVREILVLKPFSVKQTLLVEQPAQKMAFARELYLMIPRNLLLSKITVTTNRENLEYRFALEERVNLEKFWKSTELQMIWASIHDLKTLSANVEVEGWTNSSFRSTTEMRSRSRNFLSLSVQLKPGLNTFQLMFLDSSRALLTLDSLRVFYEIPSSTERVSDEFQNALFHASSVEKQCKSCHTDSAASCVTCHKGLVTLPSVHPIAEDCSTCHNLESSKESKLIEGQEFNADFCFSCHDDKKELLETKPVVHATAKECLMCHDPHGTTFDTMVRDRTTLVCKTCHDEKASEPHPVANHPIEGPKDPYRPNKKLTCTSCHNPHASEHAKLFRFPEEPICQYCHGKR